MSKLTKVLITLVVLVGVIALAGFAFPEAQDVSRSTNINASPQKIYQSVGVLPAWPSWSPWKAADSTMVYSFSGPKEGVGATSEWKSENSGDGKLTVTKADEAKGIEFDLWFDDGENSPGGIRFEKVSDQETKVTWYFTAHMGNNPIGRWFGLMMDGMVGPDFEKGLAGIKAQAEAAQP